MKFDTIERATYQWVEGMNAIPQALLEKAYPNMDADGLFEITPVPTKWECDSCGEEFSQEEVDELESKGHIDSYGHIICPSCFELEKDNFYNEREDDNDNDDYTLEDSSAYIEKVEDYENQDYGLPMWSWLWNPESIDEVWIRENLETVSECGFRIYESDEVGILLGIDGAGYDFYEEHWIPLYKARGLQWHKAE